MTDLAHATQMCGVGVSAHCTHLGTLEREALSCVIFTVTRVGGGERSELFTGSFKLLPQRDASYSHSFHSS